MSEIMICVILVVDYQATFKLAAGLAKLQSGTTTENNLYTALVLLLRATSSSPSLLTRAILLQLHCKNLGAVRKKLKTLFICCQNWQYPVTSKDRFRLDDLLTLQILFYSELYYVKDLGEVRREDFKSFQLSWVFLTK